MTDEELITNYLKGDADSLTILIQKYSNPIFSFICRLIKEPKMAEDLTQETFLKVWKNLKKFDREKKFKPWLFMIARNSSIDYLRKKKELVFSDLALAGDEGETLDFDPRDSNISSLEQLERQELITKLEQGLKNLPADDRALLLLYHTENISFREIGEMTKEPMATVKTRYYRALVKLKNNMVEE